MGDWISMPARKAIVMAIPMSIISFTAYFTACSSSVF